MIVIPLQLGPSTFDLAVILEQENIDRIMAYDPGEVMLEKLGTPWRHMRCRTIMVMFATQEELHELQATPSDMVSHAAGSIGLKPGTTITTIHPEESAK
jgi:hypothetical protein